MKKKRPDTARDVLRREKIRRLLHCARADEFSIIRWYDPAQALPDDPSYVLVKERDRDFGCVCWQGAFESGEFWDLLCRWEIPIQKENIIAWSYGPCDDRLTGLGELIGQRGAAK